ncbi:hypothetical protein FKR81_28215 [Lentzea tibetensis]|uniref:Uncharacterized protein n=1 Tax=Lentzea tibetensis TaxID=2591470 RepID=A0A563EMS8_9PSEU|nr:hypothetical protein [Lentzea tibetensis]TWP48477.1 hypothetical protein FKR81_28215 [Lentzea tibetensis]
MRPSTLVLVVMAMCLGPAPTAGAATTYTYSYENDYEGWVAKTDQDTGVPECRPHDSSVTRSARRARDGVHSVDFGTHGRSDCGLLWIEREFDVGTAAPVEVDLSFWVWSDDKGDIGTGGVNHVNASVRASCVTDPGRGTKGGWDGFADLGSLGHRDGPGWFLYRHKAKLTPSPSGRICVGQAVMIASTYSFIKHYHLDQTTITIS